MLNTRLNELSSFSLKMQDLNVKENKINSQRNSMISVKSIHSYHSIKSDQLSTIKYKSRNQNEQERLSSRSSISDNNKEGNSFLSGVSFFSTRTAKNHHKNSFIDSLDRSLTSERRSHSLMERNTHDTTNDLMKKALQLHNTLKNHSAKKHIKNKSNTVVKSDPDKEDQIPFLKGSCSGKVGSFMLNLNPEANNIMKTLDTEKEKRKLKNYLELQKVNMKLEEIKNGLINKGIMSNFNKFKNTSNNTISTDLNSKLNQQKDNRNKANSLKSLKVSLTKSSNLTDKISTKLSPKERRTSQQSESIKELFNIR
jgi:hypothetical protein